VGGFFGQPWALTVAVAMAVEAINSAFERLIDHLHPDIHHEIKCVTDMAAGGVLLVSIGALAVALCFAISLL
jgi:diacylglycerol kinase (ATP)